MRRRLVLWFMLSLAAVVVATAQTRPSEVVASEAADSAIEAQAELPVMAREILAGWSERRDMTEQVAAYAARRLAQTTRRARVPREQAPAELAAALEGLSGAAGRITKELATDEAAVSGLAIAEVQTAFATFKVQDLLARDEFEMTAARLALLEVDGEILNRFEVARQAYLEASDGLHRVFANPLNSGFGGSRELVLSAATEAVAILDPTPAPITALRSSLLPYRRQTLPPRDPVFGPTIVPSYLDASGVGSVAADLAPTPEAPLAEEILLKAEELGYDYVRIFEFVRNQIELEWYVGSQKGALGALRQGSGNDVDQASLLVALFRASALPSRYVHGVVELSMEYFDTQLGLTDATRVAEFLASAGLARAPVIRGGGVSAFQVELTWVSAYLPYTNYRGAVVDFSGKTWLPLAPALQGVERTSASGVLTAMGFDSNQFLADYLSAPQAVNPLATLRAAVEQYLSETGSGSYEDQLATRTSKVVRYGILPSSLPVPVTAITAERAALDVSQRVSVKLVARSGTGAGAPVIFEHDMPLADILGQRLTLSYLPATADDHQVVNAWGGLERVPAYLVRLRPQLRIGGRREAVGEGSLPMAVGHRLEVEVTGPFGSETTAQTFTAGSYHALAIGAQRFTEHLVADDPEDEEILGANLLSGIAFNFGASWDAGEQELARLMDVAVARPLPAIVIASNAVEARVILGLPHRLEWQGVTLDAALRVAEPVGRAEAEVAKDWMRLSALHGSALEHRIFEQQFLVDSLSADKALGLARARGIEVLTLDAGNIGTLLPTLQHPQPVRSAVADWVGQGMVVEIPVLQLALNAWVGSAWRVEDPVSGAGGYFLAGALAGGATTEAPENWLLDFVVDALAHLRSEPNEDPLAGVEVLKIPGGDFQIGTVGEAFPLELTVQVLDTLGRPVLGANVTFRSLAGNGKIGPQRDTTTTVQTDAGGFASVELVAGTRVLDNLIQVRRHPDDEKDTWALKHLVTATVEAEIGQLSINRPFEAIGYPGIAVSMLRTDTAETIFDDENIGFWSDSMRIEVADEYGNGVSNAEVEATALDPILGLVPFETCTDDGAGASGLLFFDALPEDDGSFRGCASTYPTREECGEPTFRVKTEASGKAVVGVIMGDSVLAVYPARVELRQVDLGITIEEPDDPIVIPPEPENPDAPAPEPVMVSYKVEVTNRGTHDAEDVRVEVTMDFPDEVEIESVEADRGSWTDPDWTIGSLGNGASTTLTINLLVPHDTPPGSQVLSVLAQASAPGDPLVNVGDDRVFEDTSVEVDEEAADRPSGAVGDGPPAAVSRDGGLPPLDLTETPKALVEIDPLEFEYSIRFLAEPFTLPPRCFPFRGRLVRTRGFVTHAATRIEEDYPLPIELIHLTSDPTDCVTAQFHSCVPTDVGDACRDACVVSNVDCEYCVEGGEGCEFVALLRDCAENLWTFRRSEIVLEASQFSITNDGLASAPERAPDGVSALGIMTAGAVPGIHEVGFDGTAIFRELKPNQETGELEVQLQTFPPWSVRPVIQNIALESIGTFHGIEPTIESVDPELVELTEGGVTASETTFAYRILPPDYEANLVVVDIEADGDFVIDLLGTETSDEGEGVLPEGSRLDAGKEHTARLLVNPGSSVEVSSDPVAVPLEGQIIRRVDDPYVLSQDTDLAVEGFCNEATPFDFYLNRPADVSLWFQRINDVSAGIMLDGEQLFAFEDQRFEEGEHRHLMKLEDLPPGDYRGFLRAVDEQGTEMEEFLALAEHGVTDHRRVGQSTLKGVNLWRGNLTFGRRDLFFPARGRPLELSRTYVSGGSAGDLVGTLGPGWSHNWQSRVEVTPCGEAVVTGGEGSGLRFADDGEGGLQSMTGSHASLVANPAGESYDFFTPGGHQYRYEPVAEGRWDLSQVSDPNGNITTLAYSGLGDDRLLRRVTDASGRSLEFFYEERNFALWEGPVLVRVEAPEGLEVRFDYDAYGNLISAEREGGIQKETYSYESVPDWAFEARWALTESINTLNGARTRYDYQVTNIPAISGEDVSLLQVKEQVDPEGGVTQFQWDTGALGNRQLATHKVMDPRGEESTFRINNDGTVQGTENPLGQAGTLEWDNDDLVVTQRVDANGVITDSTHDAYGNPLTETVTVTDFDGTEHVYTVTKTYVPTDQPPFLRNLLASRTDRNGNTTTFTYDERGNLLSQSIDVTDANGETTTVATHHTYAANGDRLTTTDANGGVTSFRYNAYGLVEQVTDALGNITSTRWNERGLPVEVTDALGRTTLMSYDNLGRLKRRQHPDEGVERVEYFDLLNLKIETDALGRDTRTTFDLEGRIVLIESAAGTQKVFEYDEAGNKILESRWFGGATPRDDIVYEYDAAGRLIQRRETLGRVTTYTHDAVGNVLSERLISEVVTDAFAPRLIETDYDELNRPIVERRQLGDGYVISRRKLDGEGNRLLELDPLDRTQVVQYDELNRPIRIDESALREHRRYYDGNGNLIRTELDVGVDGAGDVVTQARHMIYDVANRMVADVDAEGHVFALEYDAVGNVAREVDRRGHLTSHAYDSRNRRIQTTVHLDRVTTPTRNVVTDMQYDLVGNRIGETLANGNVLTYVYDPLDRLTTTTDSLGTVAAFVLDARGNKVEVTDANGNVTVNTFDVLDRLTFQNLPEDREVSYTYDVAGNPMTQTNARGHITSFVYDSLNRLVETSDAEGEVTTTEYDAVGNPFRQTDRRGSVTDFEYDELNRLVLRTDPEVDGERYSTAFTYDPADNLLTELDRRGILTEYQYDRENRRTHTTRAGLLIGQIEYDEAGNMVSAFDANRNQVFFDYDERNLRVAEREPLSKTTTFEFDDMGDLVRSVDPEGRTVEQVRDLRRRLLTATRGDDETTTYTYDGNGNRTSVLRPEGGEWTYEYDGADRLTAVVNPESDRSELTYDKNSNLATQTDGELNVTSYDYDVLDRLARMTYADATFETRNYDAESNLSQVQDPNGQVATFTYDALNRETRREYRESDTTPDFAQAVTSSWDRNNNLIGVVESTRDGADQPTTRTYDDFDRLESTTDRWGNTLVYTYDANGNRTRLTDPNGLITTYTYDALNRVDSVLIPGAGSTQFDYFKNNFLEKVAYPNGTTSEHTYDSSNRVTRIDNLHNTAAEVSSFVYSYDRNGNRTQQIETHSSLPAETTTYTFDGADRLHQVTYPDKITTTSYDAAGNRATEVATDVAGVTTLVDKTYVYNSRNQLTEVSNALDPAASVTYSYDANGNQITRATGIGSTHFTFDIRNRLAVVDQGSGPIGTYSYNFLGLRVAKQTAADGEEQYVYDDQSVLVRTSDSGRTTKYDYGPSRLISVDDSIDARAYYLHDALGSVTDMTTPIGGILGRYQWDAWGNSRGQVANGTNPFGFTGHEHDDETGLIYAKARFYDPEVGRFLSHDPAFGESSNPPSLHRYLYAFQNPTVYVDPDGRTNAIVGLIEEAEELQEELDLSVDENSTDEELVKTSITRGLIGAGENVLRVFNFVVNTIAVNATPDSKVGQEAQAEFDQAKAQVVAAVNDVAVYAAEDPVGFVTLEIPREEVKRVAMQGLETVVKASAGDKNAQGDIIAMATELASEVAVAEATAFSRAGKVIEVLDDAVPDLPRGPPRSPGPSAPKAPDTPDVATGPTGATLPPGIRSYLRDVEAKTGVRIHESQKGPLKEALREESFGPMSPTDVARHRRAFNRVKNDLIEEWEANTGQTWPRYTEDLPTKAGDGFSRYAGDPYDAHHIIENQIGGPAEWWNIHPARFPDQHQGGIHGAGSPLRTLLETIAESDN